MDLQRRCLAGEDRAWGEWIRRFGPVIHGSAVRTLVRHTGSAQAEDAADATQEVLLRLVKDDFRLLRSYDPARASLPTWLRLLARSSTIDLLRRRRLKLEPLGEAALEVAGSSAPPRQDPNAALTLPAGLLTPRQELVLRLLFDRELEVPEVARLLGVEEQTVRSAKHKALTALRGHHGVKREQR